jgi:peptide/nickel transport system substrate-binding protein
VAQAYNRRRFLVSGLVAAAAATGGVLLEACGGPAVTHPARTGLGGAVSRAPAQSGGSVVFGVDAETPGLDPSRVRWDRAGHMYARTVYDRLAALGADGRPRPYLARTITPNADHTRWTIVLRRGVRFHNGDRLTAADLEANFAAHRDSELSSPTVATVAGFQVHDAHTFVIDMREPWVAFDHWLAGGMGCQFAYVAHPSVFTGDGSTHPVGTGPFMLKKWVPGDHFSALRNPGYWRRGLPHLDSITWKPIPDDGSRQTSLEAGVIDGLHSTATQTIVDLRHNPEFNYVDDTGIVPAEPDTGVVVLNLSDPVTGDIRLRRALACATDAPRYVSLVDNGILSSAVGLFPPRSPYHTRTVYPPFDPDRARALVAEVAAEHGRAPSLTLSVANNTTAVVNASLLQRMWRAAGIRVTLTQRRQADLIDDLLLGRYQAALGRQFSASDPDVNYPSWARTSAAPVGTYAWNVARNRDPAVQAALEEGRTSSRPDRRAAAYGQVDRRLALDLPYIWLDRTVWMAATARTVVNWANPSLPGGDRQLGFFQGIVDPLAMWRAG